MLRNVKQRIEYGEKIWSSTFGSKTAHDDDEFNAGLAGGTEARVTLSSAVQDKRVMRETTDATVQCAF